MVCRNKFTGDSKFFNSSSIADFAKKSGKKVIQEINSKPLFKILATLNIFIKVSILIVNSFMCARVIQYLINEDKHDI